MAAAPRPAEQRKEDTLARLTADADCWVATASSDGTAYLVPLSFSFNGKTLLLSTLATNPTGQNLTAAARVRLGIGPTRDVVMVDGTVETLLPAEVPAPDLDRFAEHTGFDPRTLKGAWRYYVVTPVGVQAWREADEIPDRDLMRDGVWVV